MAAVSTSTTTHAGAASHAASMPLIGTLTVLGSAALFGTLGPLSRFAYELGVSPAAWVAGRGLIGLATLALFIAWRARSGLAPVVRPRHLSRHAATSLLVAGFMGFTLNVGMFFAFDRV